MTSVAASAAHQRFYLLDGRDGGAARTLVHSVLVSGGIDGETLVAAVRRTLQRHPQLRSSLRMTDDGLVQNRHEPEAVTVSSTKSMDVPSDTKEVRRRRRKHVFAHGQGPLTLVDVISGREASSVTFTIHHGVFDAVSASLLVEELMRAHQDETRAGDVQNGQDDELPPTGGGIGDGDVDVDFWTEALRDAHEALPPQIRRAAGARGRRRTHSFPIPTGLWSQMADVQRKTGASRFVQVLAATGDVLCRYGNERAVCCSVVVDSRGPLTARSIGNWQNVLPLALRAHDSFETSVSEAFEALWDAMEHVGESFEGIASSVRTEELRSPAALARVLVAERSASAAVSDEDGRSWSLLPAEAPDAGEFELAISLVVDDLSPRIELDVLAGDSDPRDIDEIGEQIVLQLGGDAPFRAAEGSEFVRPGATVPTPTHLLRRVAEAVERRPDHVFVRDEARHVTGVEIASTVDFRARSLVAGGVQPGDRVVVRLPRTVELVLTMLAVWRAGAVLVPLEEATPVGRIRDIEEDCEPALILDRDRLAHLPAPEGDAALPDLRDDALAYILYTSGTTGTPKGVMVGHDNLSVLLDALDERLASTADTFIAATSVGFDISIVELVWPLTTGRTVRLTSQRDILAGEVGGQGSSYQCTPTTAQLLLASPRGTAFLNSVSTIIVAGEFLPAGLAKTLQERIPRVINGYGPTECTVFATFWDVPEGFDGDVTSIGSLLPNYEGAVLNHDGRPSPTGTPGALVLGGPAVARGYWRRPEETRRHFTDDHRGRTYDTGDFVCRTREGTLLYLGRRDLQVKVMGQRIELAAVEETLRAVPGVAGVAVSPTSGGEGLVCFVRTEDATEEERADASTDEDTLVLRLKQHALEYLSANERPVRYGFFRELPQTASGKLNRREISAWAAALDERPASAESAEPAAHARGSVGGAVTAAWSAVLGESVIEDDVSFFERGGSSVQLLRVLTLLRADFPFVTLADLFEGSTPRRLSAVLRDRAREEADQPLKPDRPVDARALKFAASRKRFGSGRSRNG